MSLKLLLVFIVFVFGNSAQSLAQKLNQSVGLSSQINLFDSFYATMYNQSISYSRTFSHAELIAHLNQTNRFDKNGLQFVLDAYPKFGSGRYAYLSYAYSNSILYTDHRMGAEYFNPIFDRMEVSLGLRYLHFATGASTTMYTGSLSYYFRSYLFTFRPFLIPNESNLGTSFQFSARKYLNEVDYLTLRIGFGVNADQRLVQLNSGLTGSQIVQLKSQNIAISGLKQLNTRFKLTYGIGLSRDELLSIPGSFVLMTTFDLGINYAF